jgi:hypothetical protein
MAAMRDLSMLIDNRGSGGVEEAERVTPAGTDGRDRQPGTASDRSGDASEDYGAPIGADLHPRHESWARMSANGTLWAVAICVALVALVALLVAIARR